MKKLFTLIFFLCPIFLSGQNTSKFQETDFVYNKEVSGGVKLLTQGFGLELNFKKTPTIRKKTVKQFELIELKDKTEYRQSSVQGNASRNSPRSYIYGKRNNFYVLSFTYGVDKILAYKGRKNGVSLYWSWKAGPSLGVLKPYHLKLLYGDGQIRDEPYSEENSDFFLDRLPQNQRIVGSSGIAHGWGDLKFRPGVVGKISAGADWASKNDYIKSAEIGLVSYVFASNVPIMVSTDEIGPDSKFWFINLYIGFLFGRKK